MSTDKAGRGLSVTPADLLGADEAPDAPRPTSPNRRSTAIGGAIPGRVQTPAIMVREFHEHFRYPMRDTPAVPDDGLRDLRRRLLRDEAQEADDAVAADDLVNVAQELADVAYVAYGTSLTYGIDLDAVLAEVHRANMTKDRGDTGKAVKGPRFQPADVAAVIHRG